MSAKVIIIGAGLCGLTTAFRLQKAGQDAVTFQPYASSLLPHQNNGNPVLRTKCWEGKLLFASSETAPQYPGYMDGAVQCADLVVESMT